MLFEYIPHISMIQFMAAAVAAGTIIILLKFGKSPEVKFLILIESLAAIWALTSGFESMSTDLEMKKFWSRISYLGISFLPACYFFFATTFSQKTEILTTRNISLLLIIPFLTIPVALTDEYHQLLWRDVSINHDLNLLVIEHSSWFWIFWAYSITLIMAGLYNLFLSISRFTAYYKTQVWALLVATMIPFTGNLMYITGINPLPGFDWTPVLFVLSGLVITFGVMKYRMFDLVPFARNKLIDTMSDGVLVVNQEGFIEDYNPAVSRIFGLELASIVHKRFTAVFSKYESLVNAFSMETDSLAEIEIAYPLNTKYFQVKISRVYDQNQKFSGHLVKINDVTSLKETEKKLKAEVEQRGRLIADLDAFAHTVAHDLRSSLGSVYASGEIIDECIREGNIEMLPEFAGMIKEAAQKAIHITQELLILATVSHQEIAKKPLDMKRIFREALKQVKDLATVNHAVISAEKEWPTVIGYGPWVEEIWVNYLTNAIKYGGTPPVVSAGATIISNHTVRFWVSDNGNGIPHEKKHLLFQKHIRLEPGKAEGYGLGLSIVKRIAEKLDGQVGFESTGMAGEGSTFWFELPLAEKHVLTGSIEQKDIAIAEEVL